ncbi:phosphoethanolamine transferase [Campylobacter sp. RM9328]|uniref:phosphoethanolamine transferase n=1 Tax=Campylobacter sp. RM9328 TaxID=1705720 RepID=UPI001475E800|nr:phosphoethanolamine transferase [Campylobacter sp. RM9328]
MKIFINLALALVCVYMCLGTGRLTYSGGYNELLKLLLNTLYLYGSVWLFVKFRYIFWLIFFPFVLFLCFYAPVGLTNGMVNEAFVMSIFGTYLSEASEFSRTLPAEYVLLSIFSLSLIIYLRKTNKTVLTKRQIFIFFTLFAVATATGKLWGIATTSSFFKSIKFFQKSYNDLKLYQNTVIKPQWQIKSIDNKYQNHVVVIGESARRDYHEIYGYSVKNNPFLSSVNGTFIDGFNAVGINTIPSLNGTLNHNRNLNLNIVDLANLSGFETFWFSNQGYLGYYDTLTTLVAKRAKNVYFMPKEGGGKFDSDLVGHFAKIFDTPSQKPRVIFLHFIGSHPIICNKLSSKEYLKYPDEATFKINCYVESIRQTDNDLKSVYEILTRNLQENNESFSMIYFSDHGLTHVKKPVELLAVEHIAKEHLQVPLLKISSDDNGRKFIQNESYQSHFPQSFAKWIGVQTENFNEISDVFEEVKQDDFLNSKMLIKNISGDPAIDISSFK